MTLINKVKVMLIGLDGMSFDVLSSLVKRGILPNFKGLIDSGCFGIMRSTIPPISPLAWPSLVTGKNPGKHGIFSFRSNTPKTSTPYTSIIEEALWDLLNESGKRVVVLNCPFTFPPSKVNGVMISGFPSPEGRTLSYPPKYISLLRSKIGEYCAEIRSIDRLDEESFLNEVYFVTKKRADATYYLMKNYEWDFFMVVFTNLDRIQHVLMGYFDKESPIYDSAKREILIEYYKEIDDILGKIISLIDENVILMIASDHGFEPLYKYVGVNNLLVQGGFIKVKREPTTLNLKNIEDFINKVGISQLIGKILPRRIISEVKMASSEIDFSASIAYSVYISSVLINRSALKNDEVYHSVKEKIINFLYSIRDDETGEKIVEKIYDKNEIYSGNYLDNAPDLIMVFKKGYEPRLWTKPIMKSVKHIKNKTGTHLGSSAQKGILIVSGKGINKGFQIEANIVDVAPTILYTLGSPISSDMDGRVLREIFEPDSEFEKRSIKYQYTSMKKKRKEYQLSKKEKEDILERLRALGYI